MKVLLTFEDRVRPDSTGVYFREAFQHFADVQYVHNEELPFLNPDIYDLCVKIDDGLEEHKFPKQFEPSVYYAIDTHLHPEWRMKLAKESEFDYIFCAQKRALELPWHTDKVFWLPLACDPNFHCIRGPRFRQYDIGFIGNVQPFWQKVRLERLDKLFKAIPNFYYGNAFFKDMAEKLSACKIIFNSSVRDDINMRVFESLAIGNMLLTNKIPWHGLFVPEQHFVEYDTDEDMIRKAKYYIENDDEREEIARHGQNEVLAKHTYIHRVEAILRTVGLLK